MTWSHGLGLGASEPIQGSSESCLSFEGTHVLEPQRVTQLAARQIQTWNSHRGSISQPKNRVTLQQACGTEWFLPPLRCVPYFFFEGTYLCWTHVWYTFCQGQQMEKKGRLWRRLLWEGSTGRKRWPARRRGNQLVSNISSGAALDAATWASCIEAGAKSCKARLDEKRFDRGRR